ncbi:Ig-like domain-containing domain [Lunatimonas salinarum]|uniref:Ig-like domain-containing domain n=1 Tax=Lunatimonas salinarum TaxID=1774590 RepID=UPI001AE04243|nr:Ig-like domain-containing domain [Lunatimonas salinarum]
MRLLFNIASAFFLILLTTACAKQSSPMGGPKDEDPPVLLNTDPENNQTNLSPDQLNLFFNEFVALDNPTKQIIITPKIQTDEVEFLANKNRVNIKLNQELEENTTYVFNFQKSIQDITEKNPAENIKLVFSTGSYIDSLTITGKIAYIQPTKNEEMKDILVGLYQETDTTDLFTAAPYYIAQADSAGNFEITNIKAGKFKLYAWHDENNSLKAEYRSEAHGYYSELIDIQQNMYGFHINIFKADISDLKVNRASTAGNNFDIVLSKPPISYDVIHPDTGTKLFARLNDRTIRLYHTEIQNDSTEISLSLRDSVGFAIDTTFYAKFEESERRPEDLEIKANSGLNFVKTLRAELTFNKPIIKVNFDSLMIKYDTAGRIPIEPYHFHFTDSSKFTQAIIEIQIPDSLNFETYQVYLGDSSVIDIEGIPNKEKLEANYKKLKQDRLADGISGSVDTDESPILIQLLNKKDELVQELYLENTTIFEFTKIEATDYKLRAIIDRNKNRRWDPGNFRQNTQPEPIYYFVDQETGSQEFILRAGWTLTDIVLEKRLDTGYFPDSSKDPSSQEFDQTDEIDSFEIPEFDIHPTQ